MECAGGGHRLFDNIGNGIWEVGSVMIFWCAGGGMDTNAGAPWCAIGIGAAGANVGDIATGCRERFWKFWTSCNRSWFI